MVSEGRTADEMPVNLIMEAGEGRGSVRTEFGSELEREWAAPGIRRDLHTGYGSLRSQRIG